MTEDTAEAVEDMDSYENLFDRISPTENTSQFVVFRLTREWYGVEITKVKEVVKVDRITSLPSSPEHIAGIVNLRGYILSVTNLRTVFGLPYEEPTEKARIIAVESGVLETGLLVDEVVESIEIPLNKIEAALLTIPPERAKYLEGQCNLDGRLIAVVNVEKILEKRA